jgi:CO/xanthine dehydrogenase Mo-binding subunit
LGEGEVRTKAPWEYERAKVVSGFWSIGATGAEVEVDTETGEIKVLKCALAVDAGKAVNPRECRGQVEGGAVMGLGDTFRERLVWEGGQLINPNLIDYPIATFKDVPEFHTELVEVSDKEGPFGARGIGESSISSVSPAIANAIYNAIGVRIRDLPITQEKVLRALRERGNAK